MCALLPGRRNYSGPSLLKSLIRYPVTNVANLAVTKAVHGPNLRRQLPDSNDVLVWILFHHQHVAQQGATLC